MELIKTIENLIKKSNRTLVLKRIMTHLIQNRISLLVVKTSVNLTDISSENKFIKGKNFIAYKVSKENDIDPIINKLIRVSLWHKSRFYMLLLRKNVLDQLEKEDFQKNIKDINQLDSVDVCGSIEPLDNDLHFFTDNDEIKEILKDL